jgi:DNA adenine methylase
VFSNHHRNRALCKDVFDLPQNGVDLVYIDTPYVSPYSDCDYTRRYHFVEGFCTYWKSVEIQPHTRTKKIKSRETAFRSPLTATDAFRRLLAHFRDPILALSYSSNGVPGKDEMFALLREVKKHVRVREVPHRYSVANHGHKVGDNNNCVQEYLFIAH